MDEFKFLLQTLTLTYSIKTTARRLRPSFSVGKKPFHHRYIVTFTESVLRDKYMELSYYLSHDIVQGPLKKRTNCSKLTMPKWGGLKCSECFILSSLSSNQICNLFKKCPCLSGLKNQDLVNSKKKFKNLH